MIGRAKAIGHVEDQIAAIEEDETHRDAVKGLHVLSIPDPKLIHWFGEIRDTGLRKERVPTSKEEAMVGYYSLNPPQEGLAFTRETFDRYTAMGREYFARIVTDHKARIQQLAEKREKLKAEILKTSPA